MDSYQLARGSAESARQSMDKETLLLILTLALFTGGIAMGFMAGIAH